MTDVQREDIGNHQPSSTSQHRPGAARPDPAASGGAPRWVGPVLVLALGSFALGTDSFVVAGILPQIAAGLRVSPGSAGQVVTAFALTYAVAAPFLATATGKAARKPLMAIALSIFIAADLGAAAAPSLLLLLVTQIASAVGAAMFTPTASAAAAALSGPARRGRALSVILGGLALGTVCGVPAGTVIGQHLGWRASMLFVAAIAVVALILLLTTLPALAAPPEIPLHQRLSLLASRPVLLIVAVTAVATASGIMIYTYIAQVLAGTAQLTGTALTIALLVWGIGASIGAFGSGWLADRYGPNRTLLVAIAGLGLSLIGVGYASSPAVVLPVMAVFGATAWAIPTPNNHRLTGLAPDLPSVAISFNSSGIYLGQALGAIIGGLLLARHTTALGLCLIAAAIAALALCLQLVTVLRAPARSAGR
jgi:DHA1 family inner membrane transport protein